MVPAKVGDIWHVSEGENVVLQAVPYLECPRCHYRVPFELQDINYRVLYEGQREMSGAMERKFREFLERLLDSVPEARAYWEREGPAFVRDLRILGAAIRSRSVGG